ncbi:MAG: cysteine desulfurase [Chloroflexi bacterium OLB15]|nr:MAG: cysteine desulfurase [Chloroflexi bacterium OLB15]
MASANATQSVYLDYAATTPTDPRVVEAMLPYFTEIYGNAHSGHRPGRRAEQAVEDARETVARILNCKPSEIVFTSGGTESVNLAIRGVTLSEKGDSAKHIVSSAIEHSAVLKTLEQMASTNGIEYTLLPVSQEAVVDPETLIPALQPNTALVSVMAANNEVGTIQPISALAAQAKARGVLMHTDAVQAAGQLPLDVQALGVDMLSLSAHKFYGPKGVGALYVRDGIRLTPSQTGGSHEEGQRAGTVNTPGVVGLAKALQLAYDEFDERTAHYRSLRDQLIDEVLRLVPNARLTGHSEQRLPGHASFLLDGLDGNTLIMHLDMKGLAASSASACKTGNPEPSSVLLAMGVPYETAFGSLRLTIGKDTTETDIEYSVSVLAQIVEKLYRLRQNYR